MMESGKYYIHDRAKDIFIKMLKVQYQDETHFKGRAMYWNLGFTGNPWILLFDEAIEIQAKDFNNWRVFNPKTEWKALRASQS